MILTALAISGAGSVRAVTTVWEGPSTGGVFNDSANWSSNVPGQTNPASDLGIFNSDTNVNGTITFNADVTCYRTFIQNTAGTISFDMGTHKWTTTDYFLVGAPESPGFPQIKFIGGEADFAYILLGTEPDSPGPSIELTGSTTVVHTSRGSGGVQIGLQSDMASLLVHNGAKLIADGQVIIGLVGSSNSSLTIDGVGSQLIAGNYLGVGHTADADGFYGNATGSLAQIINGATATASNVYMAITVGASDNTLLVSGAGSTLTLTGVNNNDGAVTNIGWRDNNNLFRVENGGVVAGTNQFVLGAESTSATGNRLEIDNGSLSGTNIQINQGSVTVTHGTVDLIQFYNEDPLKLDYEGGGIVATNGAASTFTFNSGMVRSVNATISNGSPFTVGDGGVASATYLMRKDVVGNHGTHTFTDGLVLASNGILTGDGDIVGNVSGAAGSKVQVGNPIGVVNVTGNWANMGVSIALDLANLATSLVPGQQFDQLNISGQFTNGGSITIDRTNLVGPSTTQQLKLIGWGSQSGLSSSTAVSFIGGSPLAYAFMGDGLYVTITGGGLAGDYNHDGKVDALDYVVWRKTDGTPSGYNIWRANFGNTSGAGASLGGPTAVPEPSTIILSAVLSALCVVSRRRLL